MYKGKTVCVVVPAYNEEKLIERVIETMPDFVDTIVVVDDASTDKTATVVKRHVELKEGRVVLIEHRRNEGVGGAIVTGYKWSRDNEIDISVVMAGDAQMNPDDLPSLLEPIVDDKADYVKGNRLITDYAWKHIPKYRYVGNSFLSLFTKIASGYWHVADSQSGYTAISLKILKTLNLDKIYKRFGMPNDILVMLNVYNFRVKDVPVSPIYNIGEKSGIKVRKVVFTISFLLLRRFFWRMKEKYVIRDFHPLIFFYGLAFSLFALSVPLLVRLLYVWAETDNIPKVNAFAWMVTLIMGLQSLFFAMWFDMENNKDLK